MSALERGEMEQERLTKRTPEQVKYKVLSRRLKKCDDVARLLDSNDLSGVIRSDILKLKHFVDGLLDYQKGGEGMEETDTPKNCKWCDGTGFFVTTVGHEPSGPDDPGCHEEDVPCPKCNPNTLRTGPRR